MAHLLLTERNVAHVKKALFPQAKLLGIGSSHLTEAIAAGLGFQKHASLQAFISQDVSVLPLPALVDDQAMMQRIVSLSGIEAKSLDGTQETLSISRVAWESSELPDPLWVSLKRMSNNDAFRVFDRQWRPMITIGPKQKFSEIWWDCITMGGGSGKPEASKIYRRVAKRDNWSEDGCDAFDGNRLFEVFQKNAKSSGRKKPFYEGSIFVGRVQNVPNEFAPMLADALGAELYKMHRAHAKKIGVGFPLKILGS